MFCMYIDDSRILYKCRENCFNKYYSSLQCLPNPYINQEFILLNASQTQYKICDNNHTNYVNIINSVDKYDCDCDTNCDQKYYSLELEDIEYTARNDSKIRIEYKLRQQFHYKSEKKYSFVGFLSNIGGLIGLWFGVSFIDTSALIRLVLIRIKLFALYVIYSKLYQIQFIKIFIDKFIIFIKKLLKYKLRNVFAILTIPLIIYQVHLLLCEYLHYPTQTSIEFINYKTATNRFTFKSTPAITLCYETVFQNILFDPHIRKYIQHDELNHKL